MYSRQCAPRILCGHVLERRSATLLYVAPALLAYAPFHAALKMMGAAMCPMCRATRLLSERSYSSLFQDAAIMQCSCIAGCRDIML